ncbi:hypothetical protein EMIT0P218_120149 [Pseudomonas sp. IT-P218]
MTWSRDEAGGGCQSGTHDDDPVERELAPAAHEHGTFEREQAPSPQGHRFGLVEVCMRNREESSCLPSLWK